MASTDKGALEPIDTQASNAVGADEEAVLSPASHAAEKERLEKLLKNRSDAKELQEKNILKGAGHVAPALQAATLDLQKHQLEDKLEGRLERRPEREELERRGILKDQHVAPALQGKLSELERSQLENRLEKDYASRPDVEQLRAQGILKEGE